MGKWTKFGKQHESYNRDEKHHGNDKKEEGRKGRGCN
jgi:hypothetical protein